MRTAWSITPITAAEPSGVSRPRPSSAPPPASEAPASNAVRLPGRRPIDSNAPAVASRPCPPNHPKSFCTPCEKKTAPSVARKAMSPSFMTDLPVTTVAPTRGPAAGTLVPADVSRA